MAGIPLNPPTPGWSVVIRPRDWAKLSEHLFSGRGEHGAALLAELTDGPRGRRLLVRHVILATEGKDYVPGTTGFRALTAEFVRDCVSRAHDAGLAYIPVHNHGGFERVQFSSVDLDSHERGYPTLVQFTGKPVMALVLTRAAAAGDVFLPDGTRDGLGELVVPGSNLMRLRPAPAAHASRDGRWDRQARVYGDAGQDIFGAMRVAVVGLGGAGSLITEFIARLGVGHVVLVDPQDVDETNLPRLVAAEVDDVGTPKVHVAARNARRANPSIVVTELIREVHDPKVLTAIVDCDFIFLAADSNSARHFVNQVVEESLIPGIQVGVKVPADDDGVVGRIHVAVRPMIPGAGCLWCNQLIDATELAIDLQPQAVRDGARYVDEVPAPSVIALNALAVSEAVNRFMMGMTGLLLDEDPSYTVAFPRERDTQIHAQRRDADCRFCGDR